MILGVNGIRLVGQVGRRPMHRGRPAVHVRDGQPFRGFAVYPPKPIAPEVKLPACADEIVVPPSFAYGLVGTGCAAESAWQQGPAVVSRATYAGARRLPRPS